MEKRLPAQMRPQVINNKPFFDELIAQINSGRSVVIRAKGWSMLPLVWDDRDTITLSPLTADSIRVGRIVLAQMGSGRYVVHRIVRIKGDRVELRGDGNPYQIEYVHREKVLAEMTAVRRAGKELNSASPLWKVITHLWPANGFLRRVLLFGYRRLVIRKKPNAPRRVYGR